MSNEPKPLITLIDSNAGVMLSFSKHAINQLRQGTLLQYDLVTEHEKLKLLFVRDKSMEENAKRAIKRQKEKKLQKRRKR